MTLCRDILFSREKEGRGVEIILVNIGEMGTCNLNIVVALTIS